MNTTSNPRRLLAILASLVMAFALSAPAMAQVPFDQAEFSAYSTGTVIHADGLQQAGEEVDTRVVNADVAFSGALVDSDALAGARSNEMGMAVRMAEESDGANSYGRGTGLELGGGVEVPGGENQGHIAGLAEDWAPPTGEEPVVEEAGPVPAGPLAYATAARGEAYAQWPTDGSCLLGADLSYGQGYVANAQLLDAGEAPEGQDELEQPLVSTRADSPERAVSWSVSRNFLGPQVNRDHEVVGDNAGVFSEVRQTIAPVTFFEGMPGSEFTIEFAGQWVLRAAAGGIPGTAHVHYGPGEVSPQTPLLSIIRTTEEGAKEVTRIITSQDLLGDEGVEIPIQDESGENVLANIAVGEAPRAIGGEFGSEPVEAADGTRASGAVDVVRVTLLEAAGTGRLGEVRIGHMEVEATAPSGGIECELPVTKTVTPQVVQPGDEFTYTITVDNPFSCELRNVRVEDTIEADSGISWTVTGTDPAADEVSDDRIVWNDIGPIAPGESTSVTLTVVVGEDSAAGEFRDIANASGECVDLTLEGGDDALAGLGVPVTGEVTLVGPEVEGAAATAPPRLPATGGGAAAILFGALALGGAAVLRRTN